MAELSAADNLPYRSPWLGGILSALVPGAGQGYAGRWGDAVLSLVVNAVFIGGTWQAWDTGNSVTTGVMGVFGAGFYLGNVFGGFNAAYTFNRDAADEAHRSLRKRFEYPAAGFRP